jgi:hypothetical protein
MSHFSSLLSFGAILFVTLLGFSSAGVIKNLKTGHSDLQENHIQTPEMPEKELKFEKLNKLFVVGNFDGNGIDTLFLHHYSNLTKTEIDSFPYPSDLDDWGDFISCFNDQAIESYLALNQKNKDTLHLGNTIGLYCLINIGDNNSDGKDEIALVVNHLDFSRVNSCKIYTLCKNQWTLLKEFGIHEDAFDFNSPDNEMTDPPVFYEIKAYLENHGGQWYYRDYHKEGYESLEDAEKMERLKLGKCK